MARATATYTGTDPAAVFIASERLEDARIRLAEHLAADPDTVVPGDTFTFDAAHADEVYDDHGNFTQDKK